MTDFEYFFNTFDFNTKHPKTLLQAIELDCTAKEGDLKAGSCDLDKWNFKLRPNLKLVQRDTLIVYLLLLTTKDKKIVALLSFPCN